MSLQPVYNAEAPRSERDDNGAEMQKHRAFDNPFALKVKTDILAQKGGKRVCAAEAFHPL